MKPKHFKSKGSGAKRKMKRQSESKDLSTMSVSDFMKSSLESDDSDESNDSIDLPENPVPQVNGVGNSRKLEDLSSEDEDSQDEKMDAEDESSEDEEIDTGGEEEEEDDDDDDDEEEEEEKMDAEEENDDSGEESDSSDVLNSTSHKKSLHQLRKTDPEFYKFLEENDKNLLQFNDSDSEEEEEEKDEDKVHKPNQDLEVASDESDFEVEGKEVDGRVVTLKMVQSVQDQLRNTKSLKTIKQAVKMFHSALISIAASKEVDDGVTELAAYSVEGGPVFNAVVQMCVLELEPALKKYLNIKDKKLNTPLKNLKNWKLVTRPLKMYLYDLYKFLGNVSSPEVLTVLLKHLHQLTVFLPYFSKLRQPLLKKLVKLWESGEETVRVVAFLCILRITTNEQEALLKLVLKRMYAAYVRNSKFVSPTTLPSIQFMRRSLAELFALDEAFSYQYVFLYVRQLAIHLRNGITVHTKEAIQSVYNWQFIQSLNLWTEVLGATANRPHLQPLLYPLVQVIIGTLKMIPTVQYYPLRFHCVHMLIQLSKQTGTFIPVLPFLLEVLDIKRFNKKEQNASVKPMDFTCILRLSKSQLQESGCRDGMVEKVYHQMLEYLASESHTLSFPDMVVPAVIHLKKFVKECKSPNYSRKMKQVLEKIQENSKFIETARSKVSFTLSNGKSIDAWETSMKLKGTPLTSFFESWNKINAHQKAKRASNNDKLGEYRLPTIKKFVKKPVKNEGPVELFPSDDSDEEAGADLDLSSSAKKKKLEAPGSTKKGKRKMKATADDSMDSEPEGEDIVQDLKLSDFLK